MSKKKRGRSDLQSLKAKHGRQNLLLVLFFLVVVGAGLIGLVYGKTAILASLPCLLSGAALILVLYGILWLLEKLSERLDE